MGQRNIEIPLCDVSRIGGIDKPHLLGECVGVEPINQPLAPTGDNRSLRVVDMGINKPR